MKILSYALAFQGDWQRIAQALKEQEPVREIRYFPETFVTLADPEYPEIFRHLRYPPWILFYRGDLSLLRRPCVVVTGSAECSASGLQSTADVVHILRQKYVIVSGMGAGAEMIVHREGMESASIGILASGINTVYPPQNRWLYRRMIRNHLLISEYPPGTRPLADHFPWRSRLLAAVGQFLVVTECPIRSGIINTAEEFTNLGKPVWCLPNVYGKESVMGTNWLINQGADILYDVQSVRDL